MSFEYLIGLPAVTVGVLTPLLALVAHRYALVDHPTARKVHAGPTPLVGGASILTALALTAIMVNVWPVPGTGLAIGVAIMFLVGLYDDFRPLRARYRFATQFLVAVIAGAIGATTVTFLGDVFGPFQLSLGILSIPFTIVSIVGLINAYNMTDGCDGLCGGYVAIALIWFLMATYAISGHGGHVAIRMELEPIIIPALSAIAVFVVVYNLRIGWRTKAASFLGDGGSMALGFLVAWLSIRLGSADEASGQPSVPAAIILWIVAAPLFDMIACMVRRTFLDRVTPMTPDRKHGHHILLDCGFTHQQTVFILLGTSFVMGMIGFAGWQLGVAQYVMFWILASLLSLYVYFHVNYWRKQGLADAQSPELRSDSI